MNKREGTPSNIGNIQDYN